MGWISGRILRDRDGQRLRLISGARCTELHEGDVIERWQGSCWRRGRVEHSAMLGWLWTNERVYFRLSSGEHIRLWDGRRNPPGQGGPDKLSS